MHTNTSLSRYLECPKKYYWWHVKMIDPYQPPISHNDTFNMQMGHLLHECLEARYYDDNDVYSHILEPHMDGISELEDTDMTLMIRTLIDARHDVEAFGFPVFSLQEKEKEYKIPIIEDYYGDVIEEWAGKIDGIGKIVNVNNHVITNEYGANINDTYVIDHKLRAITADYETFHTSMQLTMYTMLARHYGYDAKGYIVDVWRVPKLRKKKGELQEEYSDRIKKDIISITKKQLTGKLNQKDRPYFYMYQYNISDEDMQRMHTLVQHRLRQIREDINNDTCYPNWNACRHGRFNKKCEFFDLCRGKLDHRELRVRDKEHPELNIL